LKVFASSIIPQFFFNVKSDFDLRHRFSYIYISKHPRRHFVSSPPESSNCVIFQPHSTPKNTCSFTKKHRIITQKSLFFRILAKKHTHFPRLFLPQISFSLSDAANFLSAFHLLMLHNFEHIFSTPWHFAQNFNHLYFLTIFDQFRTKIKRPQVNYVDPGTQF